MKERQSVIKHIVMWKFQPGTEEAMHEFLAGLRALKGKIPQIREQEVGVSCVPGGYDAVLTSVFDSLEDLELYKKDPRHVEVSEKCKAIRTSRAAVDYEV